MTAPSLADYVADSAKRLQHAPITPHDLDRIDYARRCLKRAAQRARREQREAIGVSSVECDSRRIEAGRRAQAALRGTGWTASARLAGATDVLLMAHRTLKAGVAVTITAGSLHDLIAAVGEMGVDPHADDARPELREAV